MNPNPFTTLYGALFSSATISQANGAIEIHSAPGRYAMWIVTFIIVCPLAWWFWRRGRGAHYAPGIFFSSFLIPILIVPSIAIESVRVTDAALTIHTGIYGGTLKTFPISGLITINETDDPARSRQPTAGGAFWILKYRDGTTHSLDLPDLLDANRLPVINLLRARGVQIS